MSDKSLKPFDAAALVGEAGASTDADAEAASSQAAPEGQPEAGAAAPSKDDLRQTPPAVVTRAELAAILDEQNRRWQSTLDKRTAALSRQLQAQQNAERALEAARASGVVIPPDKQAEFLKALAKQGLLTGGNGQEAEGREGTQISQIDADAEGRGEALDPVTARGYAIAEEYGLTSDDPEADEIKTDSPQAYFQSIRLAGQKKINRLAKGPNPARMPGLTPGGGPAKTDLSKKPRSELLKTEVRAAMKGGAR
jgi:hypothetical protein